MRLAEQFTAKQLNRQSIKAGRDENLEKSKLKKAISQNHPDIAKIYAANAIRKQNEKLNLLRLSSRIDAVASRVQTAVTMRQVTGSMANVVKGMEGAMRSMDLEKISAVMSKFETQFEDLDVASTYYENATSDVTAVGTPQDAVSRLLPSLIPVHDPFSLLVLPPSSISSIPSGTLLVLTNRLQVDSLISQTATEAGLELSAGMLDTASVPAESEGKQKERATEEREDVVEGRLRGLRNLGELAG